MSNKRLLGEKQIRRWGKLAAIAPLTENFLSEMPEDELDMEMADELPAEEPALDADAALEVPAEEPSPELEARVEDIVAAVVDALSAETGVAIDVEGGAEESPALDDLAGLDAEEPALDAEMPAEEELELPPANRTEEDEDAAAETATPVTTEAADADEAAADTDTNTEELEEVEVVNDTELVEAVLARVVERLLRKEAK
jgi:hypothetical protein